LVLSERSALALLAGGSGGGVTYYVSPSGSDSNSGLSPSTAWQTIAHVNAQTYVAGTHVLFQGGQTFAGAVALGTANYSGVTPPTSGNPLTISSYSTGQATITPTGADAINLLNIGNIVVENLILTGDGTANHNGVNVTVDGTAGAVANITAQNLTITNFGRSGILLAAANTVNILSNVTASNCSVSNCTTNITISNNLTSGILAGIISSIGTTGSAGGTFVTTLALNNVVVSGCTVENCPGFAATPSVYQSSTGILLTNVNNPVTSTCFVSGNGANEIYGNSGIEFNWCTGGVVKFCEVYNQISSGAPSDGDGIDFDVGCQNCIAEYNYVHHNGGAGISFFNFSPFTHSGCVVRFNILENNNQASHTSNGFSYGELWADSFGGGSAPTGVAFYNNTVYNTTNACLARTDASSGAVTGHFANNLFMSATSGQPLVVYFSGSPGLITNGNLYYSANGYSWNWQGTAYTTLANYRTASGQEASSLTANPLLTSPGSGGIIGGYAPPAPTAYDLLTGSPAVGAGLNLNSLYSINPGTQDYYGNAIPNLAGYNIGAYGVDV
jgi:hypothetical protein